MQSQSNERVGVGLAEPAREKAKQQRPGQWHLTVWQQPVPLTFSKALLITPISMLTAGRVNGM
jgi:hypothetical protein